MKYIQTNADDFIKAKDWNIQSKKLESLFKEIYPQIKQNPNNFIIIKKWNKRLFEKYKFDLFKAIEEELELQLEKKIKESDFIESKLISYEVHNWKECKDENYII